MACEHKRVKSVNCVIFCMDCGAKLDKAPEPEAKKPEAKKPAKEEKTDKTNKTDKTDEHAAE